MDTLKQLGGLLQTYRPQDLFHWGFLGFGVLLLIASFQTIDSRTGTRSDQSFGVLSLFLAIACIGIGTNMIDANTIKTWLRG